MSRYGGRTEFKLGWPFIAFYMVLTALFAAATVALWRVDGLTWVTITLAGMSAMSAGAIVETLVLRIHLTDDALVVRDLRGRRSYAKSDIDTIEEARGAPPSLRLKDGRWARLPSVGRSLGNSVRAWLKS